MADRTDLAALAALFTAYDKAFGNETQYDAARLARSTTTGSSMHVCIVKDGVLLGAGVLTGAELVIAVGPHEDRQGVAEQLIVEAGAASRIASCWIAAADQPSAAALAAHGFRPDYVDVQMRRSLPLTTAPRPLPGGFCLNGISGPGDAMLSAVHDLICVAWDIAPHVDDFLERFVRTPTFEPVYWVLASDDAGLAGAVIAQRRNTADREVGHVRHVDVHPRARERGLAAALLDSCLRRLSATGLTLAQLGVHENNASSARQRYEHLGWLTVSRRALWRRNER